MLIGMKFLLRGNENILKLGCDDLNNPVNIQKKYGTRTVHFIFLFLFSGFYLFIFGERGKEREREGKKHQCVVASHVPPTGDLASNPGMCPDWESHQQPFSSQSGAQSTEPH